MLLWVPIEQRAIRELCSGNLAAEALVTGVTPLLRRRVPFDAFKLLVYDPDVILPTAAFDGGEPTPYELRLQYCANEQLEDDVNKFRELARARMPVAVLSRDRLSAPTASRRYGELLEPRGIEHELRAALVTNGACWGSLTLERARGGPGFLAADIDFVASIGSTLADGLARATFASGASEELVSQSPGVVVVDADGSLSGATDRAARWLEQLPGPESLVGRRVPLAVASVVISARAHGASSLRVRTVHGHWLSLHGSPLPYLRGQAPGAVCVVIDQARAGDLLPLVSQRYGLTQREQAVVGMVLRGLSTRRVSERLRISEHTVQDHLKSIFDKTGVRSRRELAHQIALSSFRASGPPPAGVSPDTELLALSDAALSPPARTAASSAAQRCGDNRR